MTLRGMVRISALGAILLVAIAVASSIAQGQTPQLSIERQPTIHRDTVTTRPRIWVGFPPVIHALVGLPEPAPARSYCVVAHRASSGAIMVDSVVSRVTAESPECGPELVPLVIRPSCGLLPDEYEQWVERSIRPVILLCGSPLVLHFLGNPEAL